MISNLRKHLAIGELILFIISILIVYYILGTEGVFHTIIGSLFGIIFLVLIIVISHRIMSRKHLPKIFEYSTLLLLFFFMMLVSYEIIGIAGLIVVVIGSFISFIITLLFILLTDIIEVYEIKQHKGRKNLLELIYMIHEEEELSIFFYLIFILSLSGIATYLFLGFDNTLFLWLLIFSFIMLLITVAVLIRNFLQKRISCLLADLYQTLRQHKKFFHYATAMLVVLLAILFISTIFNEYLFSFKTKEILPIKVGGVSVLPYPYGARTVVIFTNDDAGADFAKADVFTSVVDIFAGNNVSGTFFFVAKGLEKGNKWVDAAEYALARNQEIAFHSYSHRLFEYGSIYYFLPFPRYSSQKEVFEKGMGIIRDKLGIVPVGFRPTIWAENINTNKLLEESGFEYAGIKTQIFTPDLPFYRVIEGKVTDVVYIPAAAELTRFFGPRWLERLQFSLNEKILRLLLKKYTSTGKPLILVSHISRLEDSIRLNFLNRSVAMVLENKDVSVMSMREYSEWVKNYSKISVRREQNTIIIDNAMPHLVLEYNGRRFYINKAGTEKINIQ